MIYLATTTHPDVIAAMEAGELGLMNTPNVAYDLSRQPNTIWAADNGCFGDQWHEGRWWAFLERNVPHIDRCLFAAAPDVVANAQETAELGEIWLEAIASLGYPTAFVLQDGVTDDLIPWDIFDVLFVGGSTTFKLGATASRYAREALDRGKRLHMGRVNSGRRLAAAVREGYHSVDGTFLVWAPTENLGRLRRMIRRATEPALEFP